VTMIVIELRVNYEPSATVKQSSPVNNEYVKVRHETSDETIEVAWSVMNHVSSNVITRLSSFCKR
jgi:hypothetical protein